MYLQVRFLRKPLVTHLTSKWLLSSMWSIMDIKEWTAAKWLLAYVTFIWLLYWFHWWVLSSISILSCANGWIITKRQTSKFISCNFLKNVDKNWTNTQHSLKASLPRYNILGPVFFDEKFSMHVYLFLMMDSNTSVSPAARFPSAVLLVQWSTMQNTCMCLEQNCSQRWTGHPYSHWTLPYDYFLLCTIQRQNTVQEENYRILTK